MQLAYELKDSKIKVNAGHPGWVKTELGGDGATMEIPDGAKTSVALATIRPRTALTAHPFTWASPFLGQHPSFDITGWL